MAKMNEQLDKAPKAISYEEQMRNMQLLELNKKEMLNIKVELFTVKKDYEKLNQEQQRQGVGFQKYKTLASMAQQKSKKMSDTIHRVTEWIQEVKSVTG
jgi:hypothetical protein